MQLIVRETRIRYVTDDDGPSLVGLLAKFPIGRVFAALLASIDNNGKCDPALLIAATRGDHGNWSANGDAWASHEGPAALASLGVGNVALSRRLATLSCPRVVADVAAAIADREDKVAKRTIVKHQPLQPIRNIGDWVRYRFETLGDSHAAAIRLAKAERAAMIKGVLVGHAKAAETLTQARAAKDEAEERRKERAANEPKMLADFRDADDDLLAAAMHKAIEAKRTGEALRAQLIAFRTTHSRNPRAIAECKGELRWEVWPFLLLARLKRNTARAEEAKKNEPQGRRKRGN